MTRPMTIGIAVVLAIILIGHLVYWDAMSAIIGTAGVVLVIAATGVGLLFLVYRLLRRR